MDLKKLKEAVNSIPSVDKGVDRFKRPWPTSITDPNAGSKLTRFHSFLDSLKAGQFINDKLSILAHNLVQLKITLFRGEEKETKRILNKFLKEDGTNLNQLVDEVKEFRMQVDMLKDNYPTMLKDLKPHLTLENSIILHEANHTKEMEKLKEITKQQANHLKSVGNAFIKLTRK